MRHEFLSVRRHFYGELAAIALHLQGDPPEFALDLQQAEESLLRRTLRRPGFGRGAQFGARSGLSTVGCSRARSCAAAPPCRF